MHKCKGFDLTASKINGKIVVGFSVCSMRSNNCSYSECAVEPQPISN